MIRDLTTAPVAAPRPVLSPSDSRTLTVVAALIAAMTIGGGVLLWLEGPQAGPSNGPMLAAERGEPIADLTIAFVAGDAVDLAAYDGVLLPGGECRWEPQGPHVRVAVVGSGGAGLENEQVRKLLGLLGNLHQSGALDLRAVRLDPNSDPRIAGDLGAEAADLLALLQRKGIVQ